MLDFGVDGILIMLYIFFLTIRLDFIFEINWFNPVLVATDLIYAIHDGTFY